MSLSKGHIINIELDDIIHKIKKHEIIKCNLFDLYDIYDYLEQNYIKKMSFLCECTEDNIKEYIEISLNIQKLLYKKYEIKNTELYKQYKNEKEEYEKSNMPHPIDVIWNYNNVYLGAYSNIQFIFNIPTELTNNELYYKDNLHKDNLHNINLHIINTTSIINSKLLNFINENKYMDNYKVRLSIKDNKIILLLDFFINNYFKKEY